MSNDHSTIRRLQSKDGGFTLVELMVAITVLSFGLLAVASLLLTAVSMNSLGKSTNEGMAQARDKIESLKVLSASDSQLNPGGSLTSDSTGYYDTVGTFKRRWQITSGPGTAKTYTVTIIPLTQDSRRNKTVTMSTIF